MLVSKGSVIAGRYRAERRVGAGGMGEVWEGEHLALGSRVAIKTLLEGGEDNPELIARFRREAKLLGRVRSDHVARVVDFLEDPEFGLVLIMEFVEGRSLSSVLEAKTLNIDEGLDLAIDLATALADLHRAKIVHRDIKPGNIIMQPTSSGGVRAVLVDFGISRIEGHNEEDSLTGITRADIALGTVEYMAPEQILNSRQVTAASDVYAVGAILYRALSGRHVFGDRREEALARAKLIDEPPQLKVGGIDPVAAGLCEVVDKALKKRPANRLATGEKMLDLLLPLRNDRSRSEWDEETTTDGARTIAREFPPPADPRASLASIPPGGLAAGGPPGGAVPRGELDPRRSLPSVEAPHVAEARPRAASLAEMPIEPQRARVPWGPMALAIATALAVGAAIAVALTPQPLPPEAAAPPVSSSAASAAATLPAPCPTVAAAEPEVIDIDEPVASAAVSASAPPKATVAPVAVAPKTAPPAAPSPPPAPPPPRPPTAVASAPPKPPPPPPKPPPTSDPYGGAPSPDDALRGPPSSSATPPAPPPPGGSTERPRPPVDTELF